MNVKLLNAFNIVIDYYRNLEPDDRIDVIGTPLFYKREELATEVGIHDLNIELWGDDYAKFFGDKYFRCCLCGCYKDGDDIELIDIKTIDDSVFERLFPNSKDLHHRLLKHQNKIRNRLGNGLNICSNCCERYDYDPYEECFKDSSEEI